MNIHNLDKTIGIEREELPQIDMENLQNILRDLEADGIEYSTGTASTSKLKPTQSQLNIDKIQSMIDDEVYNTDRQLFISKEGYIVDGHHYWGACTDNRTRINVILVKLNIIDLINWFNNHEATDHKTINESRKNVI